jgi:hypothetical protein
MRQSSMRLGHDEDGERKENSEFMKYRGWQAMKLPSHEVSFLLTFDPWAIYS